MADVIFSTPKKNTRLTYSEKNKSEARERKRNILYLILNFLEEHRYTNAAEQLRSEAQLSSDFEACENVDLDIILQEYCSYYYTKFQKYPKIVKKLEKTEPAIRQISAAKERSTGKKSYNRNNKDKSNNISPPESDYDFQFNIVSIDNQKSNNIQSNYFEKERPDTFVPELEHYPSNLKPMVDEILQDIIPASTGITWNDCIGLQNAIESIKESTIYPLLYPDLYTNVNPWKAVLLFGPPGTGKTQLAKALANTGHTTFFNITSSTFVSKWRGDSEKMLKVLFDVAKKLAPSTIFFDELDALSSNSNNMHEASQRFKSELLMHIDGISTCDKQVFILATTNSPWSIDNAMLRRFEKRVLINLPDTNCRIDIFRHFFKDTIVLTDAEWKELGEQSQLFSGSDIKTVFKEVLMSTVRHKIRRISSGDQLKKSNEIATFKKVKEALMKVMPSLNEAECSKYTEWDKKHGCS